MLDGEIGSELLRLVGLARAAQRTLVLQMQIYILSRRASLQVAGGGIHGAIVVENLASTLVEFETLRGTCIRLRKVWLPSEVGGFRSVSNTGRRACFHRL